MNRRSTSVRVGHFEFLNLIRNFEEYFIFYVMYQCFQRDLYLFDASLKYPANISMTTVNTILTFYFKNTPILHKTERIFKLQLLLAVFVHD